MLGDFSKIDRYFIKYTIRNKENYNFMKVYLIFKQFMSLIYSNTDK